MPLPITAYPMATSDKSAEYDNLLESKLMRQEQEAGATIKGAQALGQLPSAIGSALDTGMQKGLDAEAQAVDVETLDRLYREAPTDARRMGEYAKGQLQLSDEDMKRYDPLIRATMQEAKKTRDPKIIYEFYKMIDDTVAAKAKATKDAMGNPEGRKGIGASGLYVKADAIYRAKNPNSPVATTMDLDAIIQEDPELLKESLTYDADEINKAKPATASASRLEQGQQVIINNQLEKINKVVATKEFGDMSKRIVDIVRQFPRMEEVYNNEFTAIDQAMPAGSQPLEGSTIDASEADFKANKEKAGTAANTVASAIDRFKIAINTGAKAFAADNAAVKALLEATLPKAVAVAIANTATVNGPLWQLLITHLRNTSGAAVTDGEYARFATALGLNSANTNERMNSISYFLGNSLADMRNEHNKLFTGLSGTMRKGIEESGAQFTNQAQKAEDAILSMIKADGGEKNSAWAQKVLDFAKNPDTNLHFAHTFAEDSGAPAPTEAPAVVAPKATVTPKAKSQWKVGDPMTGPDGSRWKVSALGADGKPVWVKVGG